MKGGGGQAKAYAIRTREEGVDRPKYLLQKVPFCMDFVIFSYAKYFYHTLLSLVTTFISVL